MTLRLSSSMTVTNKSNSNASLTIDGYMKQITEDTSISLAQKNTCLKTLTVVLKNLIDSSKGAAAGDAGLKYRTLNTDNPKLRARLFCASVVLDLLADPSLVGMATVATDTTKLTMEEAPSSTIRDVVGLRVLPAIATAQRTITTRIELAASMGNATKKARLAEQQHNESTGSSSTNTNTSTSTSVPFPATEKLSEKQKARRLIEQRSGLEREREKAFRRETRAKIAADKLVRQTDENWKPAVSAAADKTGTGLLSFRDRHGEVDE